MSRAGRTGNLGTMKNLIPVAMSLVLMGCPDRKITTETAEAAIEEPAPPPRPCEDILFDMEQAVVGGDTRCKKDEDCGCFDEEYDTGKCGMVTRKDTVKKIELFAAEARAAGCDLPRPCPDFTCKPHCRLRGSFDGFCTELTRCVELSEAFEKVLSEGSIKCKKDEDCGTYRAGVGQNCGGVTGRETADRLAKIADEFFEIDCQYTVNCAPRASFHGECKSGVCLEVPDF